MSSSATLPSKKPETYHHGNLKSTLLEAARVLADEVGVDNFTLREVARRAGVSPAAPYHHFEDKNDLVRGLALEAFEKLTIALETARTLEQDSQKQLLEMGLAYVRFALANPNEFRFMFRRELCAPVGQPDPLRDAGEASQAVLGRAIAEGLQKKTLRGDVQTIGLMLWSVVHGLANILLETPFGKNIPLEPAVQMATRVITQSLESVRR